MIATEFVLPGLLDLRQWGTLFFIGMKIYLDTSVLSAMFDTRNPERLEITREFFGGRLGDRLIVSELTLAEIAATPDTGMRTRMSEVADHFETVRVTSDVDRLAARYIGAGAFAEAFSADAYHVAIAVVCGADVILSWNFRHIVRRKTRDVVNMVNTMHGYPHIEIASPGELL